MTTTHDTPRFIGRNAKANYLNWLADNARFVCDQADNEGRALRGEFGPERQIVALSEWHKELKAAGRLDEAQAVKARAVEINNTLKQQEA